MIEMNPYEDNERKDYEEWQKETLEDINKDKSIDEDESMFGFHIINPDTIKCPDTCEFKITCNSYPNMLYKCWKLQEEDISLGYKNIWLHPITEEMKRAFEKWLK
jgi:hypothetical protein